MEADRYSDVPEELRGPLGFPYLNVLVRMAQATTLPTRERQVLELALHGADVTAAGKALHLSGSSIKRHRGDAVERLRAVNTAHAVRIGAAAGLLELPKWRSAISVSLSIGQLCALDAASRGYTSYRFPEHGELGMNEPAFRKHIERAYDELGVDNLPGAIGECYARNLFWIGQAALAPALEGPHNTTRSPDWYEVF